jgi:hypothetical protein
MDIFLLSSFVFNPIHIVSIAFKQLLKTVRVIQIVAFLNFVEIDFLPITKLFMKSLHKFTTFKILPQEFIDYVENFLKSNILENKKVQRRLEELKA